MGTTGTGTTTGAASGGATGATAGTGSAGGTGGTGGQTSGTGGSGAKAPIVVGMVGWYSGIGAVAGGTSREGFLTWTKMVNARGGVNGHPIKLYVGDDGGNESRSLAIVRDFVENKGAIAIVNYMSTSAGTVANYARQHNVPLVGGGTFQSLWNTNPMLFPQMSSGDGHSWGWVKLAKNAGVSKIATMYCAESPACAENNALAKKYAQEVGVEIVYEGQHSFTQPDFTADCIEMNRRGAEGVIGITIQSALISMAQSCGRQGYLPRWMLPVSNDDMLKVKEFHNAIAVFKTFPYFLRSGPPAVLEYAEALRRYLPNRYTNGSDTLTWGWVAAKMFERVALRLPDRPRTPDVLNALWSMRGDTLYGLAPGKLARTFTKGKPTPETFCVFEGQIRNGKWAVPRGMTPVCR